MTMVRKVSVLILSLSSTTVTGFSAYCNKGDRLSSIGQSGWKSRSSSSCSSGLVPKMSSSSMDPPPFMDPANSTDTTSSSIPSPRVSSSSSSSSSSSEMSASSRVDELLSKVDLSAATSSIGDVTSSALSKLDTSLDFESIRKNMFDGELGKRGEEYSLIQLSFLACILFGGLPLIGDALFFVLGPGMLLIGLYVVISGVIDMGSSFSPWPVPAPGASLVEDGIYSKVRHPIYAGVLLSCAGFSVLTGSAVRLLLTALFYYAVNVKIDYEEDQLFEKYGYKYSQYQQEVPGRLFPQDVIDDLPWNKSE